MLIFLALLSLFYRYITTAAVLELCFSLIQIQVHGGRLGFPLTLVTYVTEKVIEDYNGGLDLDTN